MEDFCDITFLTAHPLFYVIFVAFLVYFPSQVTYLLNISVSNILCDIENTKIFFNLILACWRLYERDIVSDFFLASIVLAI